MLVSAASLFYLHHLRSCAASATGACATGGKTICSLAASMDGARPSARAAALPSALLLYEPGFRLQAVSLDWGPVAEIIRFGVWLYGTMAAAGICKMVLGKQQSQKWF
jgi:hypothetical protein